MTSASPTLRSLRRELTKTLTFVTTVWLSAVFLTMAFGIKHEVDDLMDDALQEAAEVIYGVLAIHASTLPLATGSTLPAPPHEERLVWQIVSADQQVVLRSHKAPDEPLIPQYKAGFSDAPAHWRVYAMPLPSPNHVLYVAQHGLERLESRYEFIAVVGLSAILVGLLCAAWMGRRVLRALLPLRTLAMHIKQFDPLRPETQLPPPTRQEFVEVSEAIADLGNRLLRRVESEQAFAAHAAHSLRTPLAGMQAQLALALKEATEEARPRLQRVKEAVTRLKRVVTSLLALFRSNAELDLQSVSLSELVSRLPVDALVVHVGQRGAIKADPNLLAAALVNLFDNVVKYGSAECWLSGHTDGSTQYLTVRDAGPGLSPQRRLALQQSLDLPLDAGFVGLGLKLANLVAHAHQGRVRIDEPEASQVGFSITLILWESKAAP